MATRDIEPLGVLDRATKLVETETLGSRGVNSVRILSESKFFEIVRDLVEEYLEKSIEAAATDSAGSCAPHDQKLSREYERRWESLRTRHEIGIQQVERRLDRLSRVLRKLEAALKRAERSGSPSALPVEAAAGVETTPRAPEAPVDKKALMREMLLGDDAA